MYLVRPQCLNGTNCLLYLQHERDFRFSSVGQEGYSIENIHPNTYIYGQERRDAPIILNYLKSKL